MKLDKKPIISLESCGTRIVYPDHYSMVIVQNKTERDNIPCAMRQNGMYAVIVEELYAKYQLKTTDTSSLCENSSWVRVVDEGTEGAFPIYYAGENIIVDTSDPYSPVIHSKIALGEEIDTAYRGDRGAYSYEAIKSAESLDYKNLLLEGLNF